MDALAAVAQGPEGVAALKEEENRTDVLRRFLDTTPRMGGTEDALHAAKRLLREIESENEM